MLNSPPLLLLQDELEQRCVDGDASNHHHQACRRSRCLSWAVVSTQNSCRENHVSCKVHCCNFIGCNFTSAKIRQGSDASRLKLHAEAAWPAAAEESFRQGNWTSLRHDLAIRCKRTSERYSKNNKQSVRMQLLN